MVTIISGMDCASLASPTHAPDRSRSIRAVPVCVPTRAELSHRLFDAAPRPGQHYHTRHSRILCPQSWFVTNGCLSHRLLEDAFQGRRASCARRLPITGNLHDCVWTTIGGRYVLAQRGAVLAHADSYVREFSLGEIWPCLANMAERLFVPARLPVSEGLCVQGRE